MGSKEADKTEQLSLLAIFIVQFSYSYMTTGKTIALTIQTFVGQVSENNYQGPIDGAGMKYSQAQLRY